MDFRMFPLRDYNEAELMALPADSRLLFADGLADGVLTYDTAGAREYGSRRRRVLKSRPDVSHAQLTTALARVRALRCISHGISAFSLYPTTDMQYNVNKFLWQAANDFSFKASTAATLFNRNVFIISMPASLFDFLTAVTWEQLERAMLFVLVNLASDAQGLETLHNELAPALAEHLVRGTPPDFPEVCEPNAFRLLLDHVMDRIVWMGPWIVPTTLCYLSASDMTELLARRYERPIFATPEKFELVHSMMWNIFRDWQTYRHILVKLGGRSRLDALEIMARTISKGTQTLVDEGVRTLLQLISEEHNCQDIPFDVSGLQTPLPLQPRPRRPSFISLLPADVILGTIMPKLCEVYASDETLRRRNPFSAPAEEAPRDPPSPVAVPFSLKSWVLEDLTLHQFYHSQEMNDVQPVELVNAVEEMQDVEPGHMQALEPVQEVVPLIVEPMPGAMVGRIPEVEEVVVVEVEDVDLDDDVLHGRDSPRTQRRRLNEQGSFQIVTSTTEVAASSRI